MMTQADITNLQMDINSMLSLLKDISETLKRIEKKIEPVNTATVTITNPDKYYRADHVQEMMDKFVYERDFVTGTCVVND